MVTSSRSAEIRCLVARLSAIRHRFREADESDFICTVFGFREVSTTVERR